MSHVIAGLLIGVGTGIGILIGGYVLVLIIDALKGRWRGP